MKTRLMATGALAVAAMLVAGCSGSGPDADSAAQEDVSAPAPGWTPPPPAYAAKPLRPDPILDSPSQYRLDSRPGGFEFFANEIEGTNSCNLDPATGGLPITLTCSTNFNADDLPDITWRNESGPPAGIALTADAVTAIPEAGLGFNNPAVRNGGLTYYLEPGHTVDFGNGFSCTALEPWGLDCSSPGAGFQKVDWGQAVLRGNVVPSPYAQ